MYKGLADSIEANDLNRGPAGRPIILPATFIGGHRHMAQLYQASSHGIGFNIVFDHWHYRHWPSFALLSILIFSDM